MVNFKSQPGHQKLGCCTSGAIKRYHGGATNNNRITIHLTFLHKTDRSQMFHFWAPHQRYTMWEYRNSHVVPKKTKHIWRCLTSIWSIYNIYIFILYLYIILSYKWKHFTLHFYPKKFKRNVVYVAWATVATSKTSISALWGTSSRSKLWSFHPQCLQRMAVSISRESWMVGGK